MTFAKSAFAALAFTLMATGIAVAAECTCCKDMACDMPCCDKKADAAPKAGPEEHQH